MDTSYYCILALYTLHKVFIQVIYTHNFTLILSLRYPFVAVSIGFAVNKKVRQNVQIKMRSFRGQDVTLSLILMGLDCLMLYTLSPEVSLSYISGVH